MYYNYSLDKITLLGSVHPRTPVHGFVNALYASYVSGKPCYGLEKPVVQTSETINDYRLCKYRCSVTLRFVDDIEGSFYIAWCFNGDYTSQSPKPYHFKIEFNPNKSGLLIWKAFVRSVDFRVHDISKFDVAFDVPNVSIGDVLLETKADVMSYGKVLNKTCYIAPKEQRSGRVKIYDKKQERAERGELIDDTLRIEVTIRNSSLRLHHYNKLSPKDLEEIEKVVARLNSVKWRVSSSTLDWKTFALSKLSPTDLDVALSMMSSASRAKYRSVLNNSAYNSLNIDVFTFISIVTELLRPYSCFDILAVNSADAFPLTFKASLLEYYRGG